MTLNKLRHSHAHHNYNACQCLKKVGGYPDWIITTAFYSALHFVRYQVFPLKKNNRNYPEFDDYISFLKSEGRTKKAKHQVLMSLTKENLNAIYPYYRTLRQYCDNARYYDYNINPTEVEFALKYLEEIKKRCDNDKT